MDSPDSNELLLMSIESAVARARTASNTEHWEALVMNLALVQMQSYQLTTNLQVRLVNRDTSVEGIG